MKKIVSVAQSYKLTKKLKAEGKTIILAGGCFDILHIGHITFFQKAKKTGDILILLLESDDAIKILKGKNRPINLQNIRANILAAVQLVDFVVLLPKIFKTKDYNRLVENISPDVIAVTEGDTNIVEKRLQAKKAGGILKVVLKKVPEYSTTKLWKLLNEF